MKLTKPVIVIDHLKRMGRITAATARAAYGDFALAEAVFRLRNSHTHLVPKDMEIITLDRHDAAGNLFAEYRLVPTGLPAFITEAPVLTGKGARRHA